jgi:hypothetical protein
MWVNASTQKLAPGTSTNVPANANRANQVLRLFLFAGGMRRKRIGRMCQSETRFYFPCGSMADPGADCATVVV